MSTSPPQSEEHMSPPPSTISTPSPKKDSSLLHKYGDLQYCTRPMVGEDLGAVYAWCKEEGWSIMMCDLTVRLNLAPNAWTTVVLRGEPVGFCCSYSYKGYGFVGITLMSNDHRKRGVGGALLKETIRKLKSSNELNRVGLYSVPKALNMYPNFGINQTYWKACLYTGTINTDAYKQEIEVNQLGVTTTLVRDEQDLKDLIAYDATVATIHEGESVREQFFKLGYNTPAVHMVVARKQTGEVVGYGYLGCDAIGNRIGPLFAEDMIIAAQIMLKLWETNVAESRKKDPDGETKTCVLMESPDCNTNLAPWAEKMGLELDEIAYTRMFNKEDFDAPWEKVYALTDTIAFAI